MSLFNKGKTICIVNKLENELVDNFIDRGNFIVSQKMQNDDDYDKVISMSRVYANNKQLGCVYNNDTMTQLNIMAHNATTN